MLVFVPSGVQYVGVLIRMDLIVSSAALRFLKHAQYYYSQEVKFVIYYYAVLLQINSISY